MTHDTHDSHNSDPQARGALDLHGWRHRVVSRILGRGLRLSSEQEAGEQEGQEERYEKTHKLEDPGVA